MVDGRAFMVVASSLLIGAITGDQPMVALPPWVVGCTIVGLLLAGITVQHFAMKNEQLKVD